jgi:hypothetical protein
MNEKYIGPNMWIWWICESCQACFGFRFIEDSKSSLRFWEQQMNCDKCVTGKSVVFDTCDSRFEIPTIEEESI